MKDLRGERGRVLAILRELGPMTHGDLIAEHRRRQVVDGWPMASDSGIRSRCSELVRLGYAREYDRNGVTMSGQFSIRWVATDQVAS